MTMSFYHKKNGANKFKKKIIHYSGIVKNKL